MCIRDRESTILSHGMPYPENLSFAREVEKIIREQGAIPATMAIIDGRLKCGLTEDELVRMCEAKGVLKVSRRDLPIVVAQKLTEMCIRDRPCAGGKAMPGCG